jgi:hypothetical protein
MRIEVEPSALPEGAKTAEDMERALAQAKASLISVTAAPWTRGPIDAALARLSDTLGWALDQARLAAEGRARCLINAARAYDRTDRLGG